MDIAALAPVKVAGIVEHRYEVFRSCRIAQFVMLFHFIEQDVEIDALYPARRTDEAAVDDFVREAHGLENLSTLVGVQRRDPHLRHDLEHALGDAFLVRLDDGVIRGIFFLVQ